MFLNKIIYKPVIKLLQAAIVAGLCNSFISPAVQAADIFGNTGLQFEVDTIIEFEFVESNGAFQSSFGVINLDTGEKTPLLVEVKASDTFQDPSRPSDFQDDAGTGSRKDFRGTPGNTVPQPLAEFRFKANTRYGFYLESTYNGRPAGILYSTDSANPNNQQQVEFQGDFQALANNGSLIRWDDTGIVKVQQERDFDDFIIRAGGNLDCGYNNVSNP
jgi:hypothetical protein